MVTRAILLDMLAFKGCTRCCLWNSLTDLAHGHRELADVGDAGAGDVARLQLTRSWLDLPWGRTYSTVILRLRMICS